MSNLYIYTLTNPGAESGSIAGWTANGGFNIRSSDPAPRTGSYYFMGGNQARGAAWQDISIANDAANTDIDTGQSLLYFSWYQAGFDATNDQGTVSIHFMNAAGAPISNIALPFVVASRNWDKREFSGNLIPALTRTIRVQMNAVRNSGTNNDGYFDDLSQVVISYGSDSANLTSEYVETATTTVAGASNLSAEYVEVGTIPISSTNVTAEYVEVGTVPISSANVTAEYVETATELTAEASNISSEYVEVGSGIVGDSAKVFQLSVQVESPVTIENITKVHQLYLEGITSDFETSNTNIHQLYVEAIVLLQEVRPQVLVAGI